MLAQIIVEILIGALIGVISCNIIKRCYGCWMNIFFGIIGGVFGGIIGNLINIYSGWLMGPILAAVGACIANWMYCLKKRK